MKVSIIIPIYNVEFYLSRCLDSLINQTYQNIEIIAINDGSKDNSLNILKDYSLKYSNIVIINKENEGVSKTRNIGIEKATGNLIMFVDSDDWIDNNTVEVMVKHLIEENADIVKCGYIFDSINKQKEVPIVLEKKIFSTQSKQKLYLEFINTYNYNSACTQLFKKSLIKKIFNSDIKIGEDLLFNLDLFTNANVVVSIPECYYHYYYNDNSATTIKSIDSMIKRCDDTIEVYSKLEKYAKCWGIYEKCAEEISYRILKEINMKFLAFYQLQKINRQEIKNMFLKYVNNEIIVNNTKKIKNFYVLKHLNKYSVYIYLIKKKNYTLYNFLAIILYKSIYNIKKRKIK